MIQLIPLAHPNTAVAVVSNASHVIELLIALTTAPGLFCLKAFRPQPSASELTMTAIPADRRLIDILSDLNPGFLSIRRPCARESPMSVSQT